MTESMLPSFKKPPVVETVLGVQFDPIRGFTNAHLGAFWKFLSTAPPSHRPQGEWTNVSDAPSLPFVFEEFGEAEAWSALGAKLSISQDPSSRVRIQNPAGDRMIQLQNGRLHYNWKRTGDEAYIRYTAIRPQFDHLVDSVAKFLSAEQLEPMKVNQWEVTYVNHMDKGTVWSTPADWSRVFPKLLGGGERLSAATLENLSGQWRLAIPDKRGRLHMEIRHAKHLEQPNTELLVFKLTARGKAKDRDELSNGLDVGREVIVKTFAEVTSIDAHKYWEREDA